VPEVRIAAEPRTEFGKGPARRIRQGGRVPAVLYGHHTEPRHVILPGHEVLMALRTPNVLIRLEGLPDGVQLALPKAIQRNPIKGWVEHVDLLTVRRGEKVTVDIPVTVVGEVVSDGLLDQQLVQISVEAEATNIPAGIEVDVENMPVGASVHAADLKLPAGVSLADDPDLLVLHVLASQTAAEFEAEIGAPEGEAAPATGEGAPATPEAAEGGRAAGGEESA
jgi:large subunit ribosomal protein L25